MDRVNRLRGLLCSCVFAGLVALAAPAAFAQKAEAVRPEVGKPLQAAPMSIAPARSAPSAWATSGAALGVISSWLIVATSTRSMS